MKKKFLFFWFCLAVIYISGCEGPVGPAGQLEFSVFGSVEFTSDTVPTYAYVIVSNISSIPTVKLNQDFIKFRDLYSGGTHYWDTLRTLTAGDGVQLAVSGNQGIADAVVRIPQQFTIQFPDPDSVFILPPNNDFTASWNTSSFSDYYTAYFYLNYSYVPTGGGSKYFSFDLDTILSTTSLIIPAAQLFPEDFDSLTSWSSSYGYFNIIAINGPKPEVGAQGNITGNGIGFFFGMSDGGHVEIRVQNSAIIDSGTKLEFNFRNKQSERFYKKFLKWKKINN
jgi:hypothetical protein